MEATDWGRYDVPGMWSMLSDFDTGPQWTHVGGWRKTYELTSLHLLRIRSYRDRLATAWPPERNEASRVYVAELDRLITSVQATSDAALANHSAMSGATGAISSARHQLKPLYERWRSNESLMASYEAGIAAGASGRPALAPSPAPIPVGWREPLNARAREVMGAVSAELAEATHRLVRPPDYSAPSLRVHSGAEPSSHPSISLVPPTIPRVVPRRAPENPSGTVTAAIKRSAAVEIHQMFGISPSPQGRVRVSTVIAPAAGRATSATTSTNSREREPRSAPMGRSTGGATRPMPPGGVIGTPPALVVAPGPRGNGPAARANPIGGVITPGLAMTAGSPLPASRSAPPRPSAPAGRTDAVFRTQDGHLVTISDRNARRRVTDPDDPWTVADGVSPVIEAPPEPRFHDPGPAIGLDR